MIRSSGTSASNQPNISAASYDNVILRLPCSCSYSVRVLIVLVISPISAANFNKFNHAARIMSIMSASISINRCYTQLFTRIRNSQQYQQWSCFYVHSTIYNTDSSIIISTLINELIKGPPFSIIRYLHHGSLLPPSVLWLFHLCFIDLKLLEWLLLMGWVSVHYPPYPILGIFRNDISIIEVPPLDQAPPPNNVFQYGFRSVLSLS